MKTVKPMTGSAIFSDTLNQLRLPKYGSIKLDGIRCLIVGQLGQSRSGKPIRNKYIQKCLAPLAGRGFDGELMVYDKNGDVLPFNEISSAVMSVSGEPNFTYNVFELWNNGRSYENRYQDLWRQVQYCQSTCPQLVMHSHILIRSMDELLKFERTALTAGHEGIILREPVSWYKHGESTLNEQSLLKLKRVINADGEVVDYIDAEGIVVGFDEYMITDDSGKYTDELGNAKSSGAAEFKVPGNMIGQLHLRLKNGVEVAVGSGFTFDQRKALWEDRASLNGKIVKFKYFKHGTVIKPRHPVFLGIRDPIDLDPDPFGLAIV